MYIKNYMHISSVRVGGESDIVEVHVLGLLLKVVVGGERGGMEGGTNFSTGKNWSFKLLG